VNESTTIEFLNQLEYFNLKKSDDKYSSFDAFDKGVLVEIKNRREYYREKMIECDKLFVNYKKAQLYGKKFLYIVTDAKGVWIYNITKNIELIIKSQPIAIYCPATTDIKGNNKITKYVYKLDESLATKIN